MSAEHRPNVRGGVQSTEKYANHTPSFVDSC